MISGRNPTGVQRVVSQLAGIGGILSMLHHSREAEREADALAVVNLREAGYDPDGLTAFFEKLLEINDRDPGTLATMFATHPPSRERYREHPEAGRGAAGPGGPGHGFGTVQADQEHAASA